MSLSSVLQTAQNSLATLTRHTGVIARNITDSNKDYYSRRDIQATSLHLGVNAGYINRVIDQQLERASIGIASAHAGAQLYANRLEDFHSKISLDGTTLSITAQIATLQASLQTYSGSPENTSLGEAAIQDARSLVSSIQDSSKAVQDFRTEIDREIAQEVGTLNGLLSEFAINNSEIVKGTSQLQDVNDLLDRRSELLHQIADIVPLSPLGRANNDIVLITMSGTTLYETVPRSVQFSPSTVLAPGTSGNPVVIDSMRINVTGDQPASGRLDALLRLRDQLAPSMQDQLDETARTLIKAFAETDTTGSGLPALQGLFGWPGGPSVALSGSITGLAGVISVNADYDTSAGGDVRNLRDGGSNGAAYSSNSSGAAAFASRLIELASSFDTTLAINPALGLGASMSIAEFSTRSGAWIAGMHADASISAERIGTKHARVLESLSSATGVNVDLEMGKLGELENGYQASARLLNVADKMIQSLLDVAG